MTRSLYLLVVLVCLSFRASGQGDPFKATGDNSSGKQPFGSYDGSNFDWVDLSGGGLNVKISFGAMTARGHESRYGFMYSSKFWFATSTFVSPSIVTTWQVEQTGLQKPPGGKPNGAGWRDTRPRLSAIKPKATCLVSGQPQTFNLLTGYVYSDENGAKHNFPNWKWNGPGPASSCSLPVSGMFTGYSSDTEGSRLDTTSGASLTLASGVGISFSGFAANPGGTNPGSYTDTNGNQWSATSAANGQNFVTINTDANSRINSVQVLDATGVWKTFTITYTTVAVTAPQSATLNVISQIGLPNGKAYVFTYGGLWGELTKVTLPTGGYIRYQYQTINNAAWSGGIFTAIPGRFLTARIVSPDGTAGSEQTTTYSYVLANVPGFPTAKTVTTTVTRPDGSYEIHNFARDFDEAYRESAVEWHDTGGALLKKQLKDWISDTNVPISSDSSTADYSDYELPAYGKGNWRISAVTTVLDDGTQSKVNKTYDSFNYVDENGTSVTETRGNIKKIEETDYGSGAPGAIARVTKFKYLHELDPSYLTPYIVNRVYAKWIGTSANTLALSEMHYDTTSPAGAHGNPSLSRAALLQAGAPNPDSDPPEASVTSWRDTTSLFDSFGNLTQTTDPGLHTTTNEYAQCTSGYLSATNYPITGLREEKVWNCSIGAPVQSKDVNQQVTTFEYVDPLNRLTKLTRPDTSYVTVAYDDTALVVTARQLINNGAATELVGQRQFDKLGRLTESRILGDPCGSLKTDTVYDTVGRVSQVSNPFCVTTETTYGLVTHQYDGLDREKKIIPPDGTPSANNTAMTYAGKCLTVTDEVGKVRKSCSDALGRIIQVFEPNAAGSLVNETDYQYDVLNNLICAVQKGTDTTAFTTCAAAPTTWRPRSFVYNSLLQLTSSSNPESGTISYAYNLDGNVQTKTAPAPNQTGTATVTITYSYDGLHRLTGKTYSNGDPSVAYVYDQTACLGAASCFNLGRRTSMTDAAGSEAWAYDVMGRVVKDQRTTSSITKITGYTYYLDGSVATLTYPGGRIVTYSYDAVTRPVSAVDVPNSVNYVTGALYSPGGGLASLQNGASLISKFYYNKRLQPCRISVKSSGTSPSQCSDAVNIGNVLDFGYDFNVGVADNGNLNKTTNNRNTARTVSYSYDEVNRVGLAATQATTGTYAWGQQFAYDVWGNLLSSTVTQGTAPPLTTSADTKNRIIGFCYDTAGNLLDQGACPGGANPVHTYKYDGENRLITTAGVTYTYDGDGKRVKKSSGTLYWYGMSSDPLAESDSSGTITNAYVYFAGRRIARRVVSTNQVNYYFADQIGTTRAVTDAVGNILDDSDSYPFGGERSYASSSGTHYKFTGKERDTESGLDDFGARYYASPLGRYIIPDWAERPASVPYANFGNPQTLNLYAYVNNNPITGIDPEGHFLLTSDAGTMGDKNGCPYCTSDPEATQQRAANSQQQHFESPDPASTHWAQTKASTTIPLPIIPELPSLGRIVTVAVDAISTTAVTVAATVGYLISPTTTATEDKDTIHYPPPSTSQQGAVNTAPITSSRSSLPRDAAGNYVPHPDAQGAHTNLGTRVGHDGVPYKQGATFDSAGRFTGRTDVTNHGRGDHTNPHFHPATGPASVGPGEPIPQN